MAYLKVDLTTDSEIAEDFRIGFEEHHNIIATSIIKLNEDPYCSETIDELFRSIHTIKGNCNMCQLDALVPLAHSIENVIAVLRNGEIGFTHDMSQLILVGLQKIKEFSEALFSNERFNEQLILDVQSTLSSVETLSQNELNQLIVKTNAILTDSTTAMVNKAQQTTAENAELNTQIKNNKNSQVVLDCATKLSPQEQLEKFREYSSLLEKKYPTWNGRIERILALTMDINQQLSEPVDELQLQAAVIMHDISFAFLEDHLIVHHEKYEDNEWQKIMIHSQLSAQFLEFVPGWELAAKIVHQHHERWDGNGYPSGLSGNDICTGAQILAIVDAYESITQPRADRQSKRTILRAVSEINNVAEQQFSRDLVTVFNQVIRMRNTKRPDSK